MALVVINILHIPRISIYKNRTYPHISIDHQGYLFPSQVQKVAAPVSSFIPSIILVR